MLAEAAWSAQKHREMSPTVPVQKEFGLGTTRGARWYSYATASSDCKVGKEIDSREFVYLQLMNGTLLRVALIGDPIHHRKDILTRSH